MLRAHARVYICMLRNIKGNNESNDSVCRVRGMEKTRKRYMYRMTTAAEVFGREIRGLSAQEEEEEEEESLLARDV